MKNKQTKKSFPLSYESDEKMERKNEKERSEAANAEFFNITQWSE